MTTTTQTQGLPGLIRINAAMTSLTILFALLTWTRGGGNAFTVALVAICLASLAFNVARLVLVRRAQARNTR